MTIRHIEIFLAVCDHECNLTKAAKSLYLAQPAVSAAVRELEEHYGIRFFDRISRRLYITEAGRQFLEYARRISGLLGDVENQMHHWDEQGILRVGASITIGSQFLPDYAAAFTAMHPGMDLRVQIAPSIQLERMLMDNALDFALIEGSVHEPDLIVEDYMDDSLMVIGPANHNGKGRLQRWIWRHFQRSGFYSGRREAEPGRNLIRLLMRRGYLWNRYGRPPAQRHWSMG